MPSKNLSTKRRKSRMLAKKKRSGFTKSQIEMLWESAKSKTWWW